MKIDLEKKISVYMFVIFVLIFVLIFAFICSSQMKFTVNKILESQDKPTIIQPKTTYTPTTGTPATTTNKYQSYEY